MAAIPVDWIAFQKMFKVPIPVPKHAEYYIETLARSEHFQHVPKLMEEFLAFQARCIFSPKKTRLEAMDRVVDGLKATDAYHKIATVGEIETVPKVDKRNEFADGQLLISLDLKSANFHTFWRYGLEYNTWEEVCTAFDVDPLLAQSKSFRQIVFGNLMPKRNQKIQAQLIHKVWEELDYQGYPTVFKHHDELIIAAFGPEKDMIRSAKEVVALLGDTLIRAVPQTKQKIPGKGQYVVDEYDIDSMDYVKRYLFGVPGNRYMMAFKEHILKEPFDERDRMFVNDGHLAMWLE